MLHGAAGAREAIPRPKARPRGFVPSPSIRRSVMSKDIQEVESQTFVETALKLGGKSEEEARKTGSLDRADEQVESLYATRYQTAHSPIHRAVWDQEFPADLFRSRPAVVPGECERVMERS